MSLGSTVDAMAADAAGYLTALAPQIPAIEQIIVAITMVIAVAIALHAVLQIPQLARDGGGRMLPKKILVELFVASVLLALPEAIEVGLGTIFQVSKPGDITSYSYQIGGHAFSEEAKKGIEVALRFLQVIGLYAFIKGWLIVKHLAGDGGGNASMGTAATHIIAGIMLINITGTLDIMQNMFGVEFLSGGGSEAASSNTSGSARTAGTVPVPGL